MMKAATTSETLVNFYQTTRRYNPEDSHLRHYQNILDLSTVIYYRHEKSDLPDTTSVVRSEAGSEVVVKRKILAKAGNRSAAVRPVASHYTA
jgi:hypothetical protein